MKLTREEVTRKILHIFSGLIIPGIIIYVPVLAVLAGLPVPAAGAWVYAAVLMGIASAAMLCVEAIRMRSHRVHGIFNTVFGAMLRKEEAVHFTGATYMIIAGFLCSVIFRHRPDVSFMALSSFIWGDAVAALVGISIGRIRIGKKSVEGFAACFVLCLCMYYLLFPFIPMVYSQWGGVVPLGIAVFASFCTAVLELFPVRIGKFVLNDNLYVPVVTGVIIIMMSRPG
jgi:dolichol kinase